MYNIPCECENIRSDGKKADDNKKITPGQNWTETKIIDNVE